MYSYFLGALFSFLVENRIIFHGDRKYAKAVILRAREFRAHPSHLLETWRHR